MRVGGQRHPPAALPPGKTRYPLYRTLCGPQGRSGRARKISPVPGFDTRTVQPVASRYTDWAIAAHLIDQYQNYDRKILLQSIRFAGERQVENLEKKYINIIL